MRKSRHGVGRARKLRNAQPATWIERTRKGRIIVNFQFTDWTAKTYRVPQDWFRQPPF